MTDNNYSAIIVTYYPDVKVVIKTVRSLIEQGFKIIIVDNGSTNISELEFLENDECTISKLGENKGIAFALNKGMKVAEKAGSEWVLSLDQDSTPAANLLEEYKKNIDLPHIGALCPQILRAGKSEDLFFPSKIIEEVEVCPTCGFFLNIKKWRLTHGYDDDFFIDFVDYDMCMKLKRANFKIYMIKTTYVIQSLGRIEQNKLFYKIGCIFNNKRIQNFSIIYNHSPFRNYYYVRNGLIYIHRYRDLLNVHLEKQKILKWEIKKIVLEKNKLKQLKSIYDGIKDFWKMKKRDRI